MALNAVAAAMSMLPEIAPAHNRISTVEWRVMPITGVEMLVHLPTSQLKTAT